MTLSELADFLRAGRGFAHKRDIDPVVHALAPALPAGATAVPNGDDCAVIADGDGYLLLAIEGLLNEFVAAEPWFAGYSSVMVNVSDIAAMGGWPIAVVDALWSAGHARAAAVLEGMRVAAAAYGVPIVGGHTNTRAEREQLAVAILGRARRLLTSFDAQPGDRLLMAIDLRGRYREPNPFWDASTSAPSARLRADLELLPALAEDGLCRAAKDISNAGAIGTALMLLECSGVGATIDVGAIPRPAGVAMERWLMSFPSFGFVLSVSSPNVAQVQARFAARDIACAVVGVADASRRVRLLDGAQEALLWDFDASPLIGCGRARSKLEAARV
jgi:hypothetical protein